jgi:hypothetical protein
MLILQNIFATLVFLAVIFFAFLLGFGQVGEDFKAKCVVSAVCTFLVIVVGSLIVIFSSDKPPVVEQSALDVRTDRFNPPSISNERSKIVESTNIKLEPETVTTTIQNFRFKGDDLKIECSGPTGNVVCKPVR